MELNELLPEAAVAVSANPQAMNRIDTLPALPQLQNRREYDPDVVGESIWKHVTRQPQTLAELIDAIRAEFVVQPDRCDRDVRAWLQQMLDEGLVDIDFATAS